MIAMPGILPMKVIKLGTSAQSRIAQACDRCRSKKIRCDGISPCCTQCANVGFECRTSDKLSRRAFPRGYTESLEERVRELQTEAKELKVSLDQKDEKIDILSKVHPDTTCSSMEPSIPLGNSKSVIGKAGQDEGEFIVEQPSYVMSDDQQDPFFAGSSSGRSLVGWCHAERESSGIVVNLALDALEIKVRESGKTVSNLRAELFFMATKAPTASRGTLRSTTAMKAPPRLESDRLVQIFFQEWAPLFPILHQPTFLKTYEDYFARPDRVEGQQSIVILHLVFSIAAVSAEVMSCQIPQRY